MNHCALNDVIGQVFRSDKRSNGEIEGNVQWVNQWFVKSPIVEGDGLAQT